jgi:hypothetical protein
MWILCLEMREIHKVVTWQDSKEITESGEVILFDGTVPTPWLSALFFLLHDASMYSMVIIGLLLRRVLPEYGGNTWVW